ncbi:MAG TPA: GYD domain-containing protein [Rhodocyclaceae bacterium]|nr:GYD domain-containing protein [Rhodocyclaceae bacterium]
MATFISLTNFTDQGIRNIKESPDRFGAVKAMAEKLGLTVKSFYYTVGQYDMVLVIEGNEDAATTLMVKVASLGNVRTQTMRAHSVDEMRKILDKMP